MAKEFKAPEWVEDNYNADTRRYEFSGESLDKLLAHVGVESRTLKMNINGIEADVTLAKEIRWKGGAQSPDIVATFSHQKRSHRVVLPIANISALVVSTKTTPKKGE